MVAIRSPRPRPVFLSSLLLLTLLFIHQATATPLNIASGLRRLYIRANASTTTSAPSPSTTTPTISCTNTANSTLAGIAPSELVSKAGDFCAALRQPVSASAAASTGTSSVSSTSVGNPAALGGGGGGTYRVSTSVASNGNVVTYIFNGQGGNCSVVNCTDVYVGLARTCQYNSHSLFGGGSRSIAGCGDLAFSVGGSG